MESRKNTERGRKAAESWTGPRTLSPLHIIAFFGDTNYINLAQIRYACEINHSPSGATRPRVSHFISVYVPIGHDSLLSLFVLLVSFSFTKHFKQLQSITSRKFLVDGEFVVYEMMSRGSNPASDLAIIVSFVAYICVYIHTYTHTE